MNALLLSIIIAFAPNDAGGRIALTNDRGQCAEGLYTAFSYADTGEHMTGCWVYQQSLVFVTWPDGNKRVYDISGFTATPEFEQSISP